MKKASMLRASVLAALTLAATFVVSGIKNPAHAVPAFARQTGMACNACHVGGFGPQLTAYGRQFKMEGYTASDGAGGKVPISAMMLGSWTHTASDQPGGTGTHDGANNNLALDQSSIFLAGKIAEHLGIFAQVTYSEIDRATAIDNVELRYANHVTIGGKDSIYGFTVNNNPSLSDPWNTEAAWTFPYIGSDLAPGPAAGPMIAGGLGQAVVGMTAYLYYNDAIYAEVGAYRRLSHGFLNDLGVDDSDGNMTGFAPYGRLAYAHDINGHPASIGLVAFHTAILPGLVAGMTDKYTDVGLDATYEPVDSDTNRVDVDMSYIHEDQTLDASYANGDSEHVNNKLHTIKFEGSWYYKDTYGLSGQIFSIWGTHDNGLYAPSEIDGSRAGKPNSSGFVLQADITPWGKDDSWAKPFANLRFGVQYIDYFSFNGAKHNYDGSNRNAAGNNTLYVFAWTAF